VVDVDLRLLRYFVAVAEERSFTRAAERLLMTQPALSRAIRSLESLVGAPLLVRRYRDVVPTEAGRVLLHHARGIHEQATAAIRLARRAATVAPRLRISAPGWDVLLLERLVSSYNRSGPQVAAAAEVVNRCEQADQLRAGAADVGLMRVPYDARGLDSEEYFDEPRVVLLRENDPLGAHRVVELRDLVGLPIIRGRSGCADGFLLWPPDMVGSGWWIGGPEIGDSSQIPAMVRLGHGIALVPQSVGTLGRGIRAVPILDCPPSSVRLVWGLGSTSRAVADLVRHATVTRPEPLSRGEPGEQGDIGPYARSASGDAETALHPADDQK
jgi:DNA-binding transcriptional LysR family regulator